MPSTRKRILQFSMGEFFFLWMAVLLVRGTNSIDVTEVNYFTKNPFILPLLFVKLYKILLCDCQCSSPRAKSRRFRTIRNMCSNY